MPQLDDGILVAFVDGELDSAAMHDIATMIAQDPEAQDKVRLLRASGPLVRAAFADSGYRLVSRSVAEMVAQPTQSSPMAYPRRRFIFAMATSAVAAAVIGFAVGLTVRHGSAPTEAALTRELLDEVADYHIIYAREPERFGEVPASKRDQIAALLGRIVRRGLQIPDLSRVGLAFQGARLLVVAGRPVAQLLYAWPNQQDKPLGLCISRETVGGKALRIERRDGVSLALWGGSGYTYVLVGWVGTDMLNALASELQSELDVPE